MKSLLYNQFCASVLQMKPTKLCTSLELDVSECSFTNVHCSGKLGSFTEILLYDAVSE